MNIKQMLTTAVILGLALGFNAFANVVYDSESTNEWFAVDVSTLTTAKLKSAPWTYPAKGGEASVENSAINLDTDLDDPLVYTKNNPVSGPVATVSAHFAATANVSTPEFSDAPQAALTVIVTGAATNWVGLVKDTVGGTNKWETFAAPVPTVGTDYDIAIEFDNRDGQQKKIRYRVGDTVLGGGWYANPIASAESISSVSFAGSGEIGNFSGANIVANAATFNGTGYATVEAAIAAAEAAGAGWTAATPVVLYADATYAATASKSVYFDENGHALTITGGVFTKSGVTYDITINADCEARINTTYYKTLDEAIVAAGASDTIVINKAIEKNLTVSKSCSLDPDGKLTCAALTVAADQTLTLAGTLAVTTATVNGAVVGETLTVNGTLTGVTVAKLTLGNGATFAYANTKLAPLVLTQAGAFTITGLANAEVGTEVITASGLDLSKISATTKDGTCLDIVNGTLTVVKEILATITTSSEAEGYDYTNGTVSVTATVKAGKTATAVLTVVGFDGATVKTAVERPVTSGTALVWDVADAMEGALVPGGAYTYTVEVMVDNKVAAAKSGEFTAAKWGADGAWFKADASTGSSVVEGGAWDGTAPNIVNNRYAVSDSTFNVTSEAGSAKFTRVDTKVSFESLSDGAPDGIEGDAIGGFVATAEGWKALTLVNSEKTWVTLTGADAPAVNTEYVIRAELDFSNASAQRVRFFVAKQGGDFVPLSCNGSQWLTTTKVQQKLLKVEFQGEGALESVKATVEDKALAEVNGVKYDTVGAALAAAKDDPAKSVKLLTNVTLAPTVAGTYKIVKNGYAFDLKLPANWTSEWDESTGTLTVIDKEMPLLEAISASGVTYGQTLANSTITGSMTNKTGTAIEGAFVWVDDTIAPNVADGRTNRLFEVVFTPDDTAHFFCATVTTSVAVERAELAVFPKDETIVQGNDAPDFSVRQITGFVLDDTISVVSGEPVFTYAYDKATSPTGTYDIVYASGFSADNYSFVSSNGTLTVVEALASYNGTNYATVQAALNAASASGGEVTLLADTEEEVEIPSGVKLHTNGHETGAVVNNGDLKVEIKGDEVETGSGEYPLDVSGDGNVTVTTEDESKNADAVKKDNVWYAVVETKPELVTAITLAGRKLPEPTAGTVFRTWLDTVTAYTKANTSIADISAALSEKEANGISKLDNYILFGGKEITVDDVVAVAKPAADTSTSGIKLTLPKVNPGVLTGFKVVYRVMKGETQVGNDITNKDAIEVPLESGTGTYRVDAVIVPDNN